MAGQPIGAKVVMPYRKARDGSEPSARKLLRAKATQAGGDVADQ